MAALSIKIEGLDGLIVKIPKTKKRLVDKARLAILEATFNCQREARVLVPKDTKNLMRSIQARLTAGGFQGIVGTNVNYAAFVEFGTRKQNPQPYLGPAFDKISKEFDEQLRKIAAELK